MKFDGRNEARYVVHQPEPMLDGAYRLTAQLTIAEPVSGVTDCVADILLNARDLSTCYLTRFRVKDGVRYATLTKRVDGADDVLADDILSFTFDQPIAVEITHRGGRIIVVVAGREVVSCPDADPLVGGALGFGVDGLLAELTDVSLSPAEPLPVETLSETGTPLRGLSPASGAVAGSIGNERYRIQFLRRDDDSYEPNVLVDDVPLGGGQWAVLRGGAGSRRDLWSSMSRYWVSFRAFEQVGPQEVVLSFACDEFDLAVKWSVAGDRPRLAIALTPKADGHFVAAYQAFTGHALDDVDEVLCGPMQHAKMVRGPESIGTAELTAPLALVQVPGPLTVGVAVPASELPFENERALGDDGQHFGLSLRNDVGEVQPVLFAPQYGRESAMEPGTTYRFELGLYAHPGELFDAYRELLRDEYGYTAYRENVFGASLTDTMHNLIDLMKARPDEDDSVEFQGSPSGWWSRAKGYIDIENDQAVRATTTSVLLSSYYLTGDDELYEQRALPTIEFHLSRNAYGWTPRPDRTVYGDPTKHRLGSTPFGVPALGPLDAMTHGGAPAVRQLAIAAADREDYWLKRTPMSDPLAMYRMTGDESHLQRANEMAARYIEDEIDEPYTSNVDPHDFANYYSKAWVELLEMYEETGDKAYLEASYREAKRYVTQLFVRPVPSGTTNVPERPVFVDRQIEITGWWDPDDLFDYPDDDIADEQVPSWMLSPSGMGFEAFKTYRLNGFSMNPAWAPFLLRLAALVDDDLLRDIAHNAVIGRFTNYPGYYFRQLSVNHMKPDFPYRGPFGNSTIYYHHAPAQLGLTIDYLLAEHQTRSAGNIEFPAEFEQNYVWFAYHVYGHRPGRFYGHGDVRLWMPRGAIEIDNPLINWITATDGRRLFISLTNSAAGAQNVRLGLPAADAGPITVIADNGAPTESALADGSIETTVSGHGITVLIVDGAGPASPFSGSALQPPHTNRPTFHFDNGTGDFACHGLTITKPDRTCYHLYVQTTTDQDATLWYSTDDGQTYRQMTSPAYPHEWTVRVDDVTASLTYYVETLRPRPGTPAMVGDTKTSPVELWSSCADQ